MSQWLHNIVVNLFENVGLLRCTAVNQTVALQPNAETIYIVIYHLCTARSQQLLQHAAVVLQATCSPLHWSNSLCNTQRAGAVPHPEVQRSWGLCSCDSSLCSITDHQHQHKVATTLPIPHFRPSVMCADGSFSHLRAAHTHT